MKEDNYNWDVLFADWEIEHTRSLIYDSTYVFSKEKQSVSIPEYNHGISMIEGELSWLKDMAKPAFYSLVSYAKERYYSKKEKAVHSRLVEIGVCVDSFKENDE